jgi:hypothetical protein
MFSRTIQDVKIKNYLKKYTVMLLNARGFPQLEKYIKLMSLRHTRVFMSKTPNVEY